MASVADFIERHRDTLVERFVEEAGRLPSARGLTPNEVIDTLYEYLATLAALSRQGHRGDPARTKQRLEETHLSLRLRQGYTQDEVTREYVLMGRLVSGLWEELPHEEQPRPEDTQLLLDELQAAMEHVALVFTGATQEDRQREKRVLRRLEALSPELLGPGPHARPLGERLAPLLDVIQEALGADACALHLVEGETLVLAASVGVGREPPGAHRTPVCGPAFAGRVACSEETLHLSDALLSPLEVRPGVRAGGLRTLLGTRLWPQGRLLGVLTVGVTRIVPFSPQQRRSLEALAEALCGQLERARLVERARESEERLRLALASAELGTWDYEPQTGTARWDARAKALFGLPPEAEVRWETFLQGLHPGDRERVAGVVRRALDPSGGGEYVVEYRTVGLTDGVERWVRASGRAFFEGGRAVRFIGTLQDISERRRAEAALRVSETRYRRIAESGMVGLLVWNASGAISDANDAFLQMLGYRREDLEAGRLDFRALTPPEHLAVTEEAVRTLKEVGVVRPFEKQYLHRDGHRVDVLISSATLEEENERGLALVLDITEHKHAEAALRESEARLRGVLSALAEGVVLLDARGELRLMNAAAERLLGATFAQLAAPGEGGPAWHIIREDGGPCPREDFTPLRALRDGQPVSGEVLGLQYPEGRRVWLSVNAQPLFETEGGRPSGVVASFFDMTAQRREAERVRTLVAAIEQSQDYIGISDARGGEAYINPAGRRLLGLPETGELPRLELLDFFAEEDRDYVRTTILPAQLEKGSWVGEFHLRHFVSGERIPVHYNGFTLRDPRTGALRGYATVTRDMRAEAALRREERRRSDFERQLIGIVSHDLRNPLHAILLSAKALLRSEELTERQAKALARLIHSAERAARLTSDLLDFTQARMGGGIPIERKSLDFHAAVRGVLEEVQLAHPERTLVVRSEGDGRGAWDGDRLAQVVTNLVGNALAYSPPGTPVEVETRGEDGEVLLRVYNVGEPIAPELLPRLFEPLQRGTDVGTAGRSIGLGLFIVRSIVHAHGGRIEVRSTAQEGTTFTVLLPR